MRDGGYIETTGHVSDLFEVLGVGFEMMAGAVILGRPGYERDTVAYLPHSCDEWIIGDAEDVQALIDDLTAVRDALA